MADGSDVCWRTAAERRAIQRRWRRERGRLGGFGSSAAKWVLPGLVAATAGGIAAALVLKRAEASLVKELEAQGQGVSRTASSACRTAAEAQVWTTLGGFGLTRERVRALQLLMQQGAAAAAQAQAASNAAQVAVRTGTGAAAGTAASLAAAAAAAWQRIFG
jgi:hypothetical protein